MMRLRSPKRLRTTSTSLTDTINTQLITTPKLRNCMPSAAIACRHQIPNKERKRSRLKCQHTFVPFPVTAIGSSLPRRTAMALSLHRYE